MRVEEEAIAPGSVDPEAAAITEAEERISVAPQWQLMWWRFRKHKLALVSTALVVLFYMVVAFADFLAYSDPHASEAQRSLIAPPDRAPCSTRAASVRTWKAWQALAIL